MNVLKKGYASPAKKLVLSNLLLFSLSAAMANDGQNQERLKQISQKGTKVYVTANEDYTQDFVKTLLKNKEHWQVVENKSEADIVFDVKSRYIFLNDKSALGTVYDARTGEKIYTTKRVNTLARFTFQTRKGVVRKLIRKVDNHLIEQYSDNNTKAG